MIETMLGEALAIRTQRKQDLHEATMAAIGASFSKGVAKPYFNSLQKVIDAVADGRRRARGLDPLERPNQDVEELRRGLGRGRKKK